MEKSSMDEERVRDGMVISAICLRRSLVAVLILTHDDDDDDDRMV